MTSKLSIPGVALAWRARAMLTRLILPAGASSLIAATAAAPTAVPARPPRIPSALTDAGEHAENLYDAAKANDWRTAEHKLQALEGDVARLRADTATSAAARQLADELAELRQSVPKHQRQTTMAEANEITLVVANLTEPYAPNVPVEVTRLDYYGRELELWSETGTAARLERAVQGLGREWEHVHAQVEARSPDVAKRFDALVARVERAKGAAELHRLSQEELDEVDELERVF
jgi:hypothetical protein